MEELNWDARWARTFAGALGVREDIAQKIIEHQSVRSPYCEDDWHTLASWKLKGGTLSTVLLEPRFMEHFTEAIEHIPCPYYAAAVIDRQGHEKIAFIIRSCDAPRVDRIRTSFTRDESLEELRLEESLGRGTG